MQRVPMAQLSPELEQRLETLWGKPVNLYRALGNQPALVAAWTEFFNSVRNESRTPRKLREIMILHTAQLARSEYEWAHHLTMARTALALTEAVTACKMTDAVHAEVKRHFSDADYVELCLTAAAYAMVSRMLDALGVELDAHEIDYAPKLS